jgi:hypothetical protein
VDEKMKKLDVELNRYKEHVKKTRPGLHRQLLR